jgi:acetyl-CoA carboxylase carboxyl transferase subunit beta
MIFKKPRNKLEGHKLASTVSRDTDEGFLINCPKCRKALIANELIGVLNVCTYCSYHFRLNTRQRLSIICDRESFVEMDKEMRSTNIIGFPEYERKLKNARLESAELDAVVCGTCTINGIAAAIFVMEPYFMMGSMGVVVGEKITRLFEKACEENLPVIGYTVSGGARMQEGILSLMQMAKVSGAVKRHSDLGHFYLCVLTDPTTGGVTASFAMEADIILAEPFAHVGFAGQRVIEQTIRKKLPDGFQKAEFLLEKGFVDDIVERKRQKKYIWQILRLHSRGEIR